ncbi:MAG: sulfotransferase [Planctomycetes bacterium]|nr:sulfotransferase [Planctomycetota bacterium]
MSTTRRDPNFLIVGAGESGTSWLTACLLQHPQIFMPASLRPEPHFFFKTAEYEKGYDHYLDRYFAAVPDTAAAVGERSSSYMFGEQCIPRIHERLPDARLIVMLREPVARAYSNWRFTVQSGLETQGFARAVALEADRLRREKDPFWREVQPFAYLARSRYGEQLRLLREHFAADQLLVLNSDWVKRHEPEALRRVCAFLDVDPDAPFGDPGTFPTSSVRSRRLQKLLRRLHGPDFDRAIERTRQADAGRGRGWRDRLLRANLTMNHPKLDERVRAELTDYLADSNRELAEHVDWDPFRWHDES